MSSGENLGPESDQPLPGEIEQLADEFLDALMSGESPDRDEWVARFPALAPGLEDRLRLIEELYRMIGRPPEKPPSLPVESLAKTETNISAQRPGELSGSSFLDILRPGRSIRIRCPHCNILLQIVDDRRRMVEVTCDGCGSTVVVDPDATRSMSEDSGMPRSIGRFPVHSLLGRGGFGSVYKCWDDRIGRFVAVKVPRTGYFSSPSEKERFFREARHAGQLNHHGIVRVHDVGEESGDGRAYIVSDFIDGLTLSDLLDTRRIDFRSAARVMEQVSDAIEHAHSRQIIHRDIKPGNILVDSQMHPWVTDFGLARNLNNEIAMTVDGEVLGTPAYMAPEQAAGEMERVDARSDVYSMGVILYRLLVGELPFRGSRRMLLHQVIHDDPISPRRINPGIPRDLETIALKAMEKEPDRRYRTARDFGDDLRRWLNHESIRARPPGTIGSLRRWCRRRPLVAALCGTVAALVFLSAGLAILWAIQQNQLRLGEQKAKQLAESGFADSRHRQSRLLVANGVRNLEENRLVESLHWFAEAMRISPQKRWVDQLRIRLVREQCPALVDLTNLPSMIVANQFSRDGGRLMACSENGLVRIHSPGFPDLPAVEFRNPDPLYNAILSGDDRLLMARSDQYVSLWSVPENRQIARLVHGGIVAGMAFDGEGSRIATSAHDSQVCLWNAATGEKVATLQHPLKYVTHVFFSSDSSRVMSISGGEPDEPDEVRVWNSETAEIVHVLEHHSDIDCAVFSPDGSQIVTTTADEMLRVWSTASPAEPRLAITAGIRIRTLHWLDDETVVAVGQSGDVRQWNIVDGKSPRSGFRLPSAPILTCIDSTKQILAAACADHFVHVVWLKNGDPVCSQIPCGSNPSALAIHTDGRILAAGDSLGLVRTWDLAACMTSETKIAHGGVVNELHFSPDGNRVLTCSDDGTARVVDTATGKPVGSILKHEQAVYDAVLDREGKWALTGSLDKSARLWDAWSGLPAGPATIFDSPVLKVAAHPADDRFAAARYNGMVSVWTFDRQQPDFLLSHREKVNCIQFSPDGRWIATSSSDNSTRLWSSENGQSAGTPMVHENLATWCTFSPDSRFLASCGRDRTARVREIGRDSDQVLRHGSSVSSAAFDKDSSMLMVTDYGGTAIVYRLENDSPAQPASARTPKNPTPLVTVFRKDFEFLDGSFHPVHPFVAIAGAKPGLIDFDPGAGGVLLWDYSADAPVSPLLPHSGAVTTARFDPQGKWLGTAGSDGLARLWPLVIDETPSDDLVALGEVLAGRELRENGQWVVLEASTLTLRYRQLKKKYPAMFQATPSEIDRWNSLRQNTPAQPGPPGPATK